jgi:hypothetical protein
MPVFLYCLFFVCVIRSRKPLHHCFIYILLPTASRLDVYAMAMTIMCAEFNAQRKATALICAAFYGRTDCARLLINAGADKEVKSNVRRRSLLCCGTFLCICVKKCYQTYTA